jgi:hypothetical protein
MAGSWWHGRGPIPLNQWNPFFSEFQSDQCQRAEWHHLHWGTVWMWTEWSLPINYVYYSSQSLYNFTQPEWITQETRERIQNLTQTFVFYNIPIILHKCFLQIQWIFLWHWREHIFPGIDSASRRWIMKLVL